MSRCENLTANVVCLCLSKPTDTVLKLYRYKEDVYMMHVCLGKYVGKRQYEGVLRSSDFYHFVNPIKSIPLTVISPSQASFFK